MKTIRFIFLLLLPMSVGAQNLEYRIKRLEQQLDNRALVDMLQTIQRLEEEVQQLRGEVEVQNHRLKTLKTRQRELYIDIDQRLQQQQQLLQAKPPAEQPVITNSETATSTPNEVPVLAIADPNAKLAQTAYKQAFGLLTKGQYPAAKQAFMRFLKQYPDSDYASNALYWLGESHYVTGDFDNAIKSFENVLNQYNTSPKVSDAMLKLGYSYYEKKQWKQAKTVLSQLQQRFPQSTATLLATKRLQKIQQEGH